MRLGQLSRQLNIEPKKIVTFLAKENIEVEDNPNTKLEDEQIELVEAHFKVKEIVEVPKKEEPKFQSILDIEPEKKEVNESVEVSTTKNIEESIEKTPTKIDLSQFESKSKPKPKVKQNDKDANFFPAEDPQEDEIVNAELLPTEKVQLGGIKVVGKIDLPEGTKKENKKSEAATSEEITATETTQESSDDTHPLKKAKLVGIKEIEVVKNKKKKETTVDPKKPFKGIKAKEIKAQKAKENKKPKKKEYTQKVEITNTEREARKRKKERQKENQSKPEKSWWAKLWESFSL